MITARSKLRRKKEATKINRTQNIAGPTVMELVAYRLNIIADQSSSVII